MRRKKQEEKIITILKNPRILLYKEDLLNDLNKALMYNQYKMSILTEETFPSSIRIDMVKLDFNKNTHEVIQWLDAAKDINNIGGVDYDYMRVWKQTSAGFICKDIKRKEYNKWAVITFNSNEGIKKALVRCIDDKLEEPDPLKYKDIMLQFSNNNIINFVLDSKKYTIVKIINIDEDWTIRQKTYEPWDLLDKYEIVEPPEDTEIYIEEEQEELF